MPRRKSRSTRVYAEPVAEAPRSSVPSEVVQSGDLQGLSDDPESDSQSVRELLEEGQFYEAEVLAGVENAPMADSKRVKTKESLDDDVPAEYTDRAPNEPRE